jgi:radical SAM superfamily enzyme YgiQ (UPF0313 family)
MSPKLLLINPTMMDGGRRRPHGGGTTTLEPLALAAVAALTPPHWDVRIVDEVLEEIPADFAPDLVGLSSLTVTAPRAYKVAQRYRDEGVPVVMGGVHATLMPEEAGRFVDVVFQGEAEGAWPQVIRDLETGSLRPRYLGRAETLAGMPIPRREPYGRRYFVQLVSGSRGCRYRCEFCSLWKMEAGRFRMRPPREVMDELETVSSRRPILFTDENVYGDREWALALFQGMVDRGIRRRYSVQASMDIADDEQVLDAMSRSGCLILSVGFESLSETSLRQMRKGVNLRIGVPHYREKVQRIHAHGMLSAGTFVFGFDGDGPDVFERTADFVLEAGIDLAHFAILTPLPGTDLFDRLAREDRLLYTRFPADYARYDQVTAVFRPHRMTPEQLEEGLRRTAQSLGSLGVAARRAWGTWRTIKDPLVAVLALVWNRTGLFGRIMAG